MYTEIKNVKCPYCGNITDAIQYDKWIAYNCCGTGEQNKNEYNELIEQNKIAERKYEIKKYKNKLFKTCGLPERYKYLVFNTFPQKTKEQIEAINICKHYIDNHKGKNLTMYGYPSTGKTALSTIITKYIINKNNNTFFTCRFLTEVELINEIVGFNQKEIYNKFFNYDLLVIDEIGLKTDIKEIVNEKTFTVINERYNRLKSTIITTNIDLTKTDNIILKRITERCFQYPNIVLYFNWQSLRLNDASYNNSNQNNNTIIN